MAYAARRPSDDRLDHGRGAGAHVTRAEHARPAGREGHGVGGQPPLLGGADALRAARRPAQVRTLADGQQDPVALDDELRAGDRLRASPARRVRRARRHALELDAGDLVVGVGHDARGRGLEDGPGALLDHLVDLVRRGHVLHVAAIDERDLPGALADRGAGAVHGGEATTDDHDPRTGVTGIGQAERGDAQVLEAVEDALGVLARDAQLVGVVAADGHAHGIEALVLEVADGEVATQLGVA